MYVVSVLKWLTQLSTLYEIQPDRDQVLLPWTSKKSVYEAYLADSNQTEADVSFTHFKATWWTNFGHKLSIRKWLRFTLCDTCVGFREQKAQTVDRVKINNIKVKEREHYVEIKAERGGYYTRIQHACNEPEEALSVVIDGADAKNYGTPYFCQATHASSKIWQIPTYLIGVLVHGRQSHVYCVTGVFEQGANVIIDVLYRTLLDIKEKEGRIPKKLYLQLDNTVKQNKNRSL